MCLQICDYDKVCNPRVLVDLIINTRFNCLECECCRYRGVVTRIDRRFTYAYIHRRDNGTRVFIPGGDGIAASIRV